MIRRISSGTLVGIELEVKLPILDLEHWQTRVLGTM